MIAAIKAGTTVSDPTSYMIMPLTYIIYDIEREVQEVTSGISEKFVSDPSKANVLSEFIIGLKTYKKAIRLKEHFLLKNSETSDNLSETESGNSSVETSNSSIHSANSLNTHLKPKNKVRTPLWELLL